jgi:hypothetical protein
MLTKHLARDLIPLVNDLDKFDMLKGYLNFRKDTIVKGLLTADSIEEVNALQGAYKELEILAQLKTYVDTDK